MIGVLKEKSFQRLVGSSVAAKILSLALVFLLVSNLDLDTSLYFSSSIEFALLAPMVYLGGVFSIQTSDYKCGKVKVLTITTLLCFSSLFLISASISGFTKFTLCMLVLFGLAPVVIAWFYRYTSKGVYIQALLTLCLQPLLVLGVLWLSHLDNSEINYTFLETFALLALFLIFIFCLYKLSGNSFIIKSLEVFFVALANYAVIYSGMQIALSSEIFVLWLLIQLGSISVFLGNNIYFYMMARNKNEGVGSMSNINKSYFYLVMFSGFILITGLSLSEHAIYFYGALLFIQGVTKGINAGLLSTDKYWVISVSNLVSVCICLLFIYLDVVNNLNSSIIVLLLSNFCSLSFIFFMIRKLKSG